MCIRDRARRAGFEMTVLRMLAFRPSGAGAASADEGGGTGARAGGGAAAARAALQESPTRASAQRVEAPKVEAPKVEAQKVEAQKVEAQKVETPRFEAPKVEAPKVEMPKPEAATSGDASLDATTWPDHVARCRLTGPAKELAAHAGFLGYEGGVLRLSLSPADDHLQMPALVKRLADALAPMLGGAPQVKFETAKATGETLHQRTARERDARQVAAETAFLADPDVQRLMERHGATVVPDSIRPFDEA